jgi:hypothetical protein
MESAARWWIIGIFLVRGAGIFDCGLRIADLINLARKESGYGVRVAGFEVRVAKCAVRVTWFAEREG